MKKIQMAVGVVAAICLAVAPVRADSRVLKSLPQTEVKVGGFWGEQFRMLTVKWLPHCVRQMEKGGRGEEMLNLVATGEFNAGKKPSVKFKGCMWSDAYPYNTVEAISLALEVDPGADAEWRAAQNALRAKVEEWIPIFLAAQEKSGYIHSFHALTGRPHFANVTEHEFYVMGYFIEMGIAHLRMTKGRDRRLFDAAVRLADHIDSIFGPAPKRTWSNGCPGIGIAFLRLADEFARQGDPARGRRYAELAQYFVRHQHIAMHHSYAQADKPAVEMHDAIGHAVRACYFYTPLTGVGARLGDEELAAAGRRIFANMIDCKFYLTGGVGARWRDEAFDGDYVLPQNGYCEACASCSLAFWCNELHEADASPTPEDVRERLLYNNVLGAISLDGTAFFYQNPLDDTRRRGPWHGCPCCIGNIPRTLIALKDRMFAVSADGRTLYVDHFVDMESDAFKMETAYPADGKVKLTIKRGAYDRVRVRFPNRTESWMYRAEPEVACGYRDFTVTNGTVAFELPLPEQKVVASDKVAACRGKVAYQKGPIVYSWEGNDPRTLTSRVANYARLNGKERRSSVWLDKDLAPAEATVKIDWKGAAVKATVDDVYAKFSGLVALHPWETAAEFKDLRVTDVEGKDLLVGPPALARCRADADGKWSVKGDTLVQANPGSSATALRFGRDDWRVGRVSFKFRKTGGKHGVMVWLFMGEGRRWPVCANLAGWFNAKNAFEAFDGYEADRSFHPGSFETGRWYDIAVTFKDGKMTALVDGKVAMETAVSCDALKLASSCTVDTATGELVVKLGNQGPRMRPVTLAFENEINPDAVKSAAAVRVLDRKTVKVYVPAGSAVDVRLKR